MPDSSDRGVLRFSTPLHRLVSSFEITTARNPQNRPLLKQDWIAEDGLELLRRSSRTDIRYEGNLNGQYIMVAEHDPKMKAGSDFYYIEDGVIEQADKSTVQQKLYEQGTASTCSKAFPETNIERALSA